MSHALELQELVRISGRIKDYKATRTSASFVFTDADRTAMGAIAIGSALAGMSAQAAMMTSNATSTEEEADYLEFSLDGKPVRGWVWRSPFKEGDAVEVAAEWRDDHYEVAGIARPADRIVALYPHCSRGRTRHVKIAVKWGLIGCTLFLSAFAIFLLTTIGIDEFVPFLVETSEEGAKYFWIGAYPFFGLITFSLARKWMPFVRLAEKVFTALGWPDPGNVDLVRSSKAQRQPSDLGEVGTFYFRY